MAARSSSAVKAWIAALCFAAVPLTAAAHPHGFINYSASILCEHGKIVGVRLVWTFDEMYSASLFSDYTSQPKGALSKADIAKLHDEAFKDSAEEHYFTDVVLDGKKLPVAATDFDASYDGRKTTYRFTVPVDIVPPQGGTMLKIDSFDTEFYIDYELDEHRPVPVENGAGIDVACAPASLTRDTTTFGALTTRIVRCRIKAAS